MKTYLKDLTPDEVIRKLKAGEVVNFESSKEKIKIIDGIISGFYPNGDTMLNVSLDLTDDILYFETPDELKIEVGKCYRTRDGRKAFISYYEASTDKYYGIIYGENLMRSWNPNGECLTVCENKDLISEWSDDDVAED